MSEHKFEVTQWTTTGTRAPTDVSMWALGDLVFEAAWTTNLVKTDLPLVKLASYGTTPNDKGSLRWAGNITAITGVEADYDAGLMSLTEAAARLQEAGIQAILYTSFRHTAAAPRWRILAPVSAPMPLARRARLVARINGVLGGVLAGESFTDGQCYYLGHREGATDAEHAITKGRFIDLCSDLDAGKIDKGRQQQQSATPGDPGQENGSWAMLASTAAVINEVQHPGAIKRDIIYHAAAGAWGRAIDENRLEAEVEFEAVWQAAKAVGGEKRSDAYQNFVNGIARMKSRGAELGALEPLVDDYEPVGTVEYSVGEEPRVIDEIEALLVKANYGLYAMVDQVVTIESDSFGQTRSTTMPASRLLWYMQRAVRLVRFDVRSQKHVRMPVPMVLAIGYLSKGSATWKLPRLKAVIHGPTITEDGVYLHKQGYDPVSQFYLIQGADWPIESMDDSTIAFWTLAELLNGFPFVTDVDLSVAFSLILTSVVRASLPQAPMHVISAPTPGTGKSYLTAVAGLLATGSASQGMEWPFAKEEASKLIQSALSDGKTVLNFDNVDGRSMGGAAINSLLSEPVLTFRTLGVTETRTVGTRVIVTANGNNIVIDNDLTRRVVVCRLDSKLENPETRAFKTNPMLLISWNRSKYHKAALTMLLDFRKQGMPDMGQMPLGGFELWSQWVRGCLIDNGLVDPVISQASARADDHTRTALGDLMLAWHDALGRRAVTATEIISAATSHPALMEALTNLGLRGGVTSTGVGMWIGKHKGRPLDRLVIQPAGRSTYRVASVDG